MSKKFVVTYFSAACLVMVFAAIQPGQAGKVAVFAAPWSDPAATVVARAGGQILSTNASGWIAIATSNDDGLVGRLYSSGALFVASSAVAAACVGIL